MACKELPQSESDCVRLSEAWGVRQEEKQRQKMIKRKNQLQLELEQGSSEAALEAALEIIRKQQPELLREP
jgi:hypothetical protein